MHGHSKHLPHTDWSLQWHHCGQIGCHAQGRWCCCRTSTSPTAWLEIRQGGPSTGGILRQIDNSQAFVAADLPGMVGRASKPDESSCRYLEYLLDSSEAQELLS